jgi:DNA-nicking Smr family endonuclease
MASEIRIDLHDVFNRSEEIDRALEDAFRRAERHRAKSLQIIHGKGSGQLKKRVARFLQDPRVRAVTRNVDNDSKNWGRVFIYFRWPDKDR